MKLEKGNRVTKFKFKEKFLYELKTSLPVTNGKIYITEDNTIVKRLENTKHEKLERFNREIQILRLLQTDGVENIVRFIDYDTENNQNPMYEMSLYEGNSVELLNSTKNNLKYTAELLLPIVNTLKILSERVEPIFHRDLKPENLLFKAIEQKPKLYLADFGCAYLEDENAHRITEDFRSVGAMAFRAPEYQYGRIENVDEKGDIFSLGKLLWYFVNGVQNEVFPYTLWYPSRYNILLEGRCAGVKNIGWLNLLIASMTCDDPEKRINYTEIVNQLNAIAKNECEPFQSEQNDKINLLEFEQSDALQIQKEIAEGQIIANIIFNDIRSILQSLYEIYSPSELLTEMKDSFRLCRQSLDDWIVDFIKSSGVGACLATIKPMRKLPSFMLEIQHARTKGSFPYIVLICRSVNQSGSYYDRRYIFEKKNSTLLMNASSYNKLKLKDEIDNVIKHVASS
ncbi:MAG: hypothetical protein A2X78_01340 [Gammaproteobacteria bacterium GWE2_37_16]|nr:MAG: hypothetical protein A2X78_01340 [Gammaproteobacteria bacterium GWE2_37_16]